MIKMNITICNNKYLEILGVEQGNTAEQVIADQESWTAAGSYAVLLTMGIAAREHMNDLVEGEIALDYAGEGLDEQRLKRGKHPEKSGPDDSGEGGKAAQEVGGNDKSKDVVSCQNDDDDDDAYSSPNRPPRATLASLLDSLMGGGTDSSGDHGPTITGGGALLRLRGDQLNNDFVDQCFEEAMRMLGAELRALLQANIGPRVLRMPGVPRYIVDEAAVGRALPCLEGRTVAELEVVLQIFGPDIEVYRPACIIMVPANLVNTWERVAQTLTTQTGLKLINLYSHCQLSHSGVNYTSDKPECGRAIHLISYSSY
ncbi:hypothetical protein C7212DRAFT_340209 [Tuber magnatum]|uniref:Uncharacterized protein n=1 Tax=Tuber magnatum TaxID=42249 RepID=A0A317T0P2_9PEZI|nr:hypothetical protein C7212DRAFT_340209 [Tuber magnatum]